MISILQSSSYVIVAIVCSFLIGLSKADLNTQSGKRSATSEPLLVPPHLIEKFTFGYSDLLADVFWLRSIQDFDFCGKHLQHAEYSETLSRELTICNQGWIFQMLDAVTRLAPRYRIAYTRGAVALSVIVNDRNGANVLFERGTEAFPTNWYVHYCASYHFQFEMNNELRAAEALRVAAMNGAPNWVILSAAKLYKEGDKAEFGLQALEQFYGNEPFEQWPQRARERWAELEKKLGRKVEPKIRSTSQE